MYRSKRRKIGRRAAFAAVAVTAFVVGGGAFTGAYAAGSMTDVGAGTMATPSSPGTSSSGAAGTASGSPGTAEGVPFPVFKIDPNSPAGMQPTGSDAATLPASSAAGAAPVSLSDAINESGAAAVPDPTGSTSTKSVSSAGKTGTPESTPTASESPSMSDSTTPVTVASPTLARTGINTATFAIIGSLFTSVGLAFMWLALRPREGEYAFALSSSNFYGRAEY